MSSEQTPIGWALLPLKKYAQFSGRSRRAEYWWFTLAYIVTGFVFDGLDLAMGSDVGLLGVIFTIALVLPTLTVSVRRLHDIGRSGWWLLVVLAPAVLFGYQSTYAALEETYNQARPMVSATTSIAAFVIACLVLMICMMLPGTKGSNRYGPDSRGDGTNAFA